MGVVVLGINGGFLPNSSSYASFPFVNSSISRLPIFHFASNFAPAKKSFGFDGRNPRFRKLDAYTRVSWICPEPVTGIASNSFGKKKSWDFDGRFCAFNTLEGHSPSVQVIEKDLKFSPMFNDYVKVMESVKTDRSKNLSKNAVGIGPKKRSMEKVASSRATEKIDTGNRRRGMDAKNKKRGDGEGSRSGRESGWGLVERIMEKRTSRRSDVSKAKALVENGREFRNRSKGAMESGSSNRLGEIRSGGSSSKELYATNVDRIGNGRVGFSREKIYHNKIKNIDKNNMEARIGGLYTSNVSLERRSSIGNEAVRNSDRSLVTKNTCYESGRFTESKAIKKDGISRMDKRKDAYGTHKFENNKCGASQRHVWLQDGSRERKNHVSKTIEMQKGCNDKVQSAHGVDYEERAAFRTFEEFTDVRNRPRVLRMELEERIQKLAKWLNATDVNMPQWQFSKIMHSAKIKFTEHSILRVVQVLGTLGNWKRALQVVEWLQTRERFKAYKSRYIYTSVLDVLGKAKRPVEALNVFYAMRQELSSYPDLATYHCIAVTLGQAGLMKELFDVIDCMRAVPEKKFKLGPLQKWDPRLEPDLVVYNAVLNACVQQKQWEGAFWVLQQFKERNIQPTNTTYGLIMETMLASEKYNLVHEVFKKVEKTSIPNALNYKVLVNTLWREGRTDEAVQAVKDMERRGVVGTASLYYDLARCLCSAGRCKEALLQINKICKVAKKPLVVTYTGLIQACLDSGSIENAAYIFSQMHKFCSPNTVTCNIMLKSYIKHGMYKEAKDLFWKIVDGSHLIRSKFDSDQRAVPDKYTFNTMMDACASTDNWDDFEKTYEQMLHHGYHFDSKRHLRLILDASRAGKSHVIKATWDHLIRFGRAPPPPLVQERFCIELHEDDHLAAISFIGAHRESGMQAFSRRSWRRLLQSSVRGAKKETIYNLAHELENLVADRDQPVYRNLLDACRDICC